MCCVRKSDFVCYFFKCMFVNCHAWRSSSLEPNDGKQGDPAINIFFIFSFKIIDLRYDFGALQSRRYNLMFSEVLVQ